MGREPSDAKGGARPSPRTYSTTDGRRRFPDLLQSVFGDKAVVGFDRYGRTLGALVPPEAVLMLAGRPDRVDDDVRRRIQRSAIALIEDRG